jgi:predicted DNA-binding protein (UPF0251 family)/predicted Fe-Mo cluster-binding NifX family protein
MTRPKKCCRIAFMPGVNYFKPAGIPIRFLEEVRLSYEETEAIRLKDIEGLDQSGCAERMNVSRPTAQRIIESARKKIADALLNGKAIRIEGGNYEMVADPRCCGAHVNDNCIQNIPEGKTMNMKIAVVTDDEVTINRHFGRAQYYMVYTVEDGKITAKEKRAKAGHHHGAENEGDHGCHSSGPHGYDTESQNKHASMASTIADCQVLIAGGMGMGAYDSLKSYKIEPVITNALQIEAAVKLYIEGKLPNLKERLH